MKLPFDKKLHLAFGALIGLCAMLIAKDFDLSKNAHMAVGAIATFVIAVGKEMYDKVSGKGTVEKADIFWTMFGGFSLIIAYQFIKTMI